MARRFCPECQSALSIRNIEDGVCDACGARFTEVFADSDLQDREPPRERRRPRRLREADEDADHEDYETLLKQSKKQSSTLLFVIAALTMVCGGLAVFILGDQRGADPIETVVGIALIACIGAIFAGLGFWAMYSPLAPTLIGLILFAGITALDMIADPAVAVRGLIFRIAIFFAMIRALKAALKVTRLAPKNMGHGREYEDELPGDR